MSKVLPWFENRRTELTNRPLIREQAFGEALDPDKLERLGRYEVHLDRKLERILSMLFRLKDPRSRESLIRSIPSESPSLRALMASAVSDEIKDPTEKAKLLKLLG